MINTLTSDNLPGLELYDSDNSNFDLLPTKEQAVKEMKKEMTEFLQGCESCEVGYLAFCYNFKNDQDVCYCPCMNWEKLFNWHIGMHIGNGIPECKKKMVNTVVCLLSQTNSSPGLWNGLSLAPFLVCFALI